MAQKGYRVELGVMFGIEDWKGVGVSSFPGSEPCPCSKPLGFRVSEAVESGPPNLERKPPVCSRSTSPLQFADSAPFDRPKGPRQHQV